MLERCGDLFGQKVKSRTEARVSGLGARPDLGVTVAGALTGHIELKAPGKGARVARLKGADRVQWKKFQALPNLIYTDGGEWALYRSGERVGKCILLSAELIEEGADSLDEGALSDFEGLMRDFLVWQPVTPSAPRALAEMLAPLCRFLREEVVEALANDGSRISRLAQDIRDTLFPDASDFQFADAYAQTVTYTLLLARFEGSERITTESVSHDLQRRHGLLARTLQIIGMEDVRSEIGLGIELLERVIGAIDGSALARRGDDPWLYFYEDFLAAYDPKLRKNYGVYYTPAPVIQAQCRLVSQLLAEKFGKRFTFADDGVVVLDPAAGTGAYLRTALAESLARVRGHYGPGDVAGRASKLAENLHAFEILVGPYAVAHLRLTQGIRDHGGELPADGVHVYLTDTLDSPNAGGEEAARRMSFMYDPLVEEHRRAREIKASKKVLVCLGNPPYDRQNLSPDESEKKRKGGWVRYGDPAADDKRTRPILEDFLQPAREAGQGVHLKNLYNDYVYFWRWALWKVFEHPEGPGIVSFITASSYLRGPGFIGMRRVMREMFDELWILDLEGDSLGPRKTENVFDIQTPVAIAIGVRYGKPQPGTPARARYWKLTGTRQEKLAQLAGVERFEQFAWEDCFREWDRPFLPEREGDFFSWPLLTSVFPWQHSGVQYKRTWPIGETQEVLVARWAELVRAQPSRRGDLFRETRDRKVSRPYSDALRPTKELSPIAELDHEEECPPIRRYGYRSFDRQWSILDPRVGDYLRPALMQVTGPEQVFLTGFLGGTLGPGPAVTVTAYLPDLHHYLGSNGGKDILPLWRDGSTAEPNVAAGLLEALGGTEGRTVSPQDLLAYVYGLLAPPTYVERFSEELTTSAPRLPITKDRDLFRATVELGKKLIFLHTFGERFVREGLNRGEIPRGRARSMRAIPTSPEGYPEDFEWDQESETLRVGEGEIGPVSQSVWEYSVSGLEVVKSWLGYRMKKPAGRSSSPLDDIRPERWTSEMTEELVHLLWILEATIDLLPELERNLDAVLASELYVAEELPEPSDEQRRAPTIVPLSDAQGAKQSKISDLEPRSD